MINAIGDYIRNLAVFLLFISFVGIVAPGEKYRDYIKLIMGFVLIFLMVSPIVRLIDSWEEVLFSFERELEVTTTIDTVHAQELQIELIVENVLNMLTFQIENLIIEHNFTPSSINIDISQAEVNFLEIKSIDIVLERPPATGIIQVDIISPLPNVEDSRIVELKNSIADFYNMSPSHIHITKR